jgi:outer membrane protein assembly factor BamA
LFLPTSGALTILKGRVGVGSTIYGLVEASHSQYFKLFELFERKPNYVFSGSHVLLLRGSIGFASRNTPIFDRFFMGGSEEMRGFRYGFVGPKDYSGDNPLGGTFKFMVSAEYIFPIWRYNENISVHGAVWTDIGNVWWKERVYYKALRAANGQYVVEKKKFDNFGEVNASVGGSLILQLWRMPIRVNYGVPIFKDSESKDWRPLDGLTLGTGFSF